MSLAPLALSPGGAQAQFVCTGTLFSGATAAGGPGNVACGTGADASGVLSFNTATGNGTNASGGESFNTATGVGAFATGDRSSNTAIGDSANASGDGTRNTSIGAGSAATGANSSAFGGLWQRCDHDPGQPAGVRHHQQHL